jgi:hypothetical protein
MQIDVINGPTCFNRLRMLLLNNLVTQKSFRQTGVYF